MNEELVNALQPDENLLWSGVPEKFETLDATHKAAFKKSAIVSSVIGILLIGGYILLAVSKGVKIMPVLIILMALGVGYSIFSTFLDANKLRKNCIYAVTDKRMVFFHNGSLSAVDHEEIPVSRFATDSDGHFCFLGGEEAIAADESKWRRFAVLGPRSPENGVCKCIVFYAISEPELFTEAVKPFLK